MKVNKNSLFAKFLFIYVGNFNDIKIIVECDFFDNIKEIFMSLAKIVVFFFDFLWRFIIIFFPFVQLLGMARIVYLTKDDLKKLECGDRDPGYYWKASVEKEKLRMIKKIKEGDTDSEYTVEEVEGVAHESGA